MTTTSLFEALKAFLIPYGITVNPPRPQDHGFICALFKNGQSALLRCSEEPKLQLELSADTPIDLRRNLEFALKKFAQNQRQVIKASPVQVQQNVEFPPPPSTDPSDLIGLAHIGENAPIGPLTSAAVALTDELTANFIDQFGESIDTTSDHSAIEQWIVANCPHGSLSIATIDYNAVLNRFPNPRQLLSWAQFRVIHSVFKQCDTRHVLASDFGNLALIQTSFIYEDPLPTLYQHDQAAETLAIQLANILAEKLYQDGLQRQSDSSGIQLNQGHYDLEELDKLLHEKGLSADAYIKKTLLN